MNRAQCLAAVSPGFDPYAAHADTGSIFSAIGGAVSSAAKKLGKVYKTAESVALSPVPAQFRPSGQVMMAGKLVTNPKGFAKDAIAAAKNVKQYTPMVQQVLKSAGPYGMVASGAIGAMQAGLSGKNLENIAWAAAKGAAPAGIDKAIAAAQALRNGSNVLQTAVSAGASHFLPGSPEGFGFNTAVSVLKKTGSKAALGVARRNLPTEGARRAFDSAIGVVSGVVEKTPSLNKRAGSIFNPSLGKAKGVLSPHQPNLKHAMDAIRRNPTLMTQNPLVLAGKFGTTQQTVRDAMKRVGTTRLLPWRSLSPTAARFVQKFNRLGNVGVLTHGTSDTAGLDETGTKYIVTKGDSPFKIAQTLTGNGNRWVELKALNTDKKPPITQNVWVGEVLNIPPDWQKPTVKTAPAPSPVAVVSQPAPTAPIAVPVSTPQVSVAPGILQAKSILVAWSKTDGVNQAGVPDYGSQAADLSTDFGARDGLELMAFQNWDNKTSNAGLPVDGKLDPKSLLALQSWAERRASQAVSPAAVQTLPEIVIEASAPSPLPVVTAPAPVLVSAPALPEGGFVKGPFSVPGIQTQAPIAAQTPSNPTPAIPAVATPAQPATPQSVAAANPAGSKMGPAMAGAAVGGVLFGLPGALIGGIAGAAMS